MLASAPFLRGPQSPSRLSPDTQTIDDLDAAICSLARRLHAETGRMLELVRDFDDRFGWMKWSFKSCAEWLAWRCQISVSAAREKVRTAQALRLLPAISAAFADGRLSYSKVRALTRVAEAHTEDLLLAYALDATAPQVEARCRQMRNVRPESTEAARRDWEKRSLTIARNPGHGTLLITVELPVEDGELIARALDRAVASREVAQGSDHVAAHGEERDASDGWRAQQADALVAVARSYLAGAGAGAAAGRECEDTGEATAPPRLSGTTVAEHYQVIVHVDEKSLRGGAGRSDLPVETVRRLTCDGNLIPLIEDARGTPLALGRKRRVVSPALRKALWSRDGGCRFPGCERKHYVDAHHLEHWAHGGETEPGNLILLCSYHHRLLHEGGFSVFRRHDGELQFLRADGRAIPRSGYSPDDMIDDPGVDAPAANPSAEGFGRPRVCEQRGIYRLSKRSRPRLLQSRRALAHTGMCIRNTSP